MGEKISEHPHTIQALKKEMNKRMAEQFSQSEIALISKTLICGQLELSSVDYMLSNEKVVHVKDEAQILGKANQIVEGIPFQYVIGETEFFGLLLAIDDRALIPRPETEELVDWIIQENSDGDKILDLCSGSGCIALGIKSKFPTSDVTALELSTDAISLILENVERLNLKVEVLQSDALDSKSYEMLKQDSFDVWVSNPPYIPDSDKRTMKDHVLNYEPSMALFVSDENPLIFYEKIATQGMLYLKPKGRLYFEIHERLAENVVSLMHNIGFVNIEVRKDLQGKQRMVRAQKRNFTV